MDKGPQRRTEGQSVRKGTPRITSQTARSQNEKRLKIS